MQGVSGSNPLRSTTLIFKELRNAKLGKAGFGNKSENKSGNVHRRSDESELNSQTPSFSSSFKFETASPALILASVLVGRYRLRSRSDVLTGFSELPQTENIRQFPSDTGSQA